MLLLPLIILATLLVILSGVWVMIALIDAVWHVERPASVPSPEADETADGNTPRLHI
jgi:hypothetical protein